MTDSYNFIERAKSKTKELGYNITQEALEHINEITLSLQSAIGNELVLATFIPMIPSLIIDEAKRRIFDREVLDLGNRLDSVRDIINHKFIQSDEGRKIFQTLIEEIIHKSEQGKIQHLKQFIVFSYTQENPNELLLRNYRRILLQMDFVHIQLWGTLIQPSEIIQKYVDSKERPSNEQLHIPYDFNADVDAKCE